MNAQEKIIGYFKKLVAATDEEAVLFASYFKEVNIKKRQFIIQPDFIEVI